MSILLAFFCIILTTEKNLDTRANVAYETWGYLCDNHIFVTALSEKTINSSDSFSTMKNIKYKGLFNVMQPEDFHFDTYGNLTNKIFRSVISLSKMSDHIDPGYDWYLKADDDTFIFVNNMRKFLEDKDQNQAITYGHDFKVIVEGGYHSGGAGYLLSKEAFNRLSSNLTKNYTVCSNGGVEDVDVNACLRKLGATKGVSIDDEGRERFHPWNLAKHYNGQWDWSYVGYTLHKPMKGLNCCSDTTISFHYSSDEMNILKKINLIYNLETNFTKKSELPFSKIVELYDAINPGILNHTNETCKWCK